MADRMASANWKGDLFEGSGTVSTETTGLIKAAGVTWAARTESADGKTSPEELLAAAHAACFCMAFANELSSRGNVPTSLDVRATATFEPPKVTRMHLDVTAAVPSADEAGFREALAAAEQSCPVSNALRGNVEINVTGVLT